MRKKNSCKGALEVRTPLPVHVWYELDLHGTTKLTISSNKWIKILTLKDFLICLCNKQIYGNPDNIELSDMAEDRRL